MQLHSVLPPSLYPPAVVLKGEPWPPPYTDVFAWREAQLTRMRTEPGRLQKALAYYEDHPVEWITHWFDTHDPRNAEKDLPTRLPLVLFQRQAELIQFLQECIRDQVSGVVDKSRDIGATWVCSAFSIFLWRFRAGSVTGWGSKKLEDVDDLGNPGTIFEKMRAAILGMPCEFWPKGFRAVDHLKFKTLINPENGSTIIGQGGDNQGRGHRFTIYFKDESAHYQHADKIEAAVSQATRTAIDISTPYGLGTVYDRKREAAIEWRPGIELAKDKTRLFVFDWSDHPEKTQAWHDKEEAKYRNEGNIAIFRQEVDHNPAASVFGIIIPPEHVNAAIDAHIKLAPLGKFNDGGNMGALDIADEGGDLNALTFRKAVLLNYAQDWGEGDTGKTARRAISEAEHRLPVDIQYDASGGYGSAVKAESNRLRSERKADGQPMLDQRIRFIPWLAGAAVINPEARLIPGDTKSPKNEDVFGNMRAQAAWDLCQRFERTFRAVTEGLEFKPEQLISIDSRLPLLAKIKRELSQPIWTRDSKLKLLVEKKPDGTKSPNLFDSIVMNYFPMRGGLVITPAAIARFSGGVAR